MVLRLDGSRARTLQPERTFYDVPDGIRVYVDSAEDLSQLEPLVLEARQLTLA